MPRRKDFWNVPRGQGRDLLCSTKASGSGGRGSRRFPHEGPGRSTQQAGRGGPGAHGAAGRSPRLGPVCPYATRSLGFFLKMVRSHGRASTEATAPEALAARMGGGGSVEWGRGKMGEGVREPGRRLVQLARWHGDKYNQY